MPVLEKFKNAIKPKKASSAKGLKAQSPSPRTAVSPAPQTAVSPPPRTAILPLPPSSTTTSSVDPIPPPQQQQQPSQDYYTSPEADFLNREPFKNSTFGIHVYGENLPPVIEYSNNDKTKLKQYEILEFGKIGRYYVQKLLQGRSYLIANDAGEVRFMKTESLDIDTKNWPSIEREIKFITHVANDSAKTHRDNFFGSILSGLYQNRFNYYVIPAGECNLVDLKARIGSKFSPASFVHIAAQTLQCVHNVQLYGYMHRYIAPQNFIIGRGLDYKTIYIVNFSISYENSQRGKTTPRAFKKFSNISLGCIPRSAHIGAKYSRIDDVESWIYCFIWLYDNTLLASKINHEMGERGVYNFKKRLFYGGYDSDLGSIKNYVIQFIRYVESCHEVNSHSVIDYPYFANIIEQMASDWNITGKENLDWELDRTNNNRIQYHRVRQNPSPPAPSKPKHTKDALKTIDEDNYVSFRSIEQNQTIVDQTQEEEAGNKANTNRRKSKTHRDKTAAKRKEGDTTAARRKNVRDDVTQEGDGEISPAVSRQQKKHAKSVPREKERKKLSEVCKKKQEEEEPSRVSKKVEKENTDQKKRKKNTVEEESTVNDQDFPKF